MNTQVIAPGMEILDSFGDHLGTVGDIQESNFTFIPNDALDGETHSLPLDWVDGVDDVVHLDRPYPSFRDAILGEIWQLLHSDANHRDSA